MKVKSLVYLFPFWLIKSNESLKFFPHLLIKKVITRKCDVKLFGQLKGSYNIRKRLLKDGAYFKSLDIKL